MTKTATSPYDVAEHLRTREEMAAYLEASIEEADGDAAFVAKALGDIARARGMAQVASDAGLSRESLYKALSGERNPTFRYRAQGNRRPGVEVAGRSGVGRDRRGRGGASLTCMRFVARRSKVNGKLLILDNDRNRRIA